MNIKKVLHLSNHNLTIGQKAADKLSSFAGSWTFIVLFFIFIFSWMIINGVIIVMKWDPYPYILLNLILSCLAAIQAPIILMSQNREAQRDRIRADYDYKVNRRAEKEISEIKEQILNIDKKLSRR